MVDFSGHSLLVGGNNIGKSTICEALDLLLGPERLNRRPILDEHDFFRSQYLDQNRNPIEIKIEAILIDLSAEVEKRFHQHLRRWNNGQGRFVDEDPTEPEAGDAANTIWALPILFIGRYDAEEDDFIGNTFFNHPFEPAVDSDDAAELKLGNGRDVFHREHKRICGFLFLRALRTGSRALSLQRGSLLDTILRLPGTGLAEMWQDTLTRLRELDPAIGDISQLKQISTEIRKRMAQFVNMPSTDDATTFFASDLTREHLREVVQLFVSVHPGAHLLPFQKLGTGSINLLVFALLTFIAELKGKQSVIFAMEEPEIALSPHTQRRVTNFILSEMGQAIVTSHSPYIIEQFNSSQIVVLQRDDAGVLSGSPIELQGIKPKVFTRQRRQFAEALLSRAVLVVEGSTEAAIFPVASSILEEHLGRDSYMHFDLAGITVFDAGGDGSTPLYGPCFKALGKEAFCFYDKPNAPLSADAQAKLGSYVATWQSPEKGIETLLTKEMQPATLRSFLDTVKGRPDYPGIGSVAPTMSDDDVRELARRVLEVRKGDNYGYAAELIAHCTTADDLPPTVRSILEAIHVSLTPNVALATAAAAVPPAGGQAT